MPRNRMASVQSRSSSTLYTISLVTETDQWQCGCPGWTRRRDRRDCTHIQACKLVGLGGKSDLKITWYEHGKKWLANKERPVAPNILAPKKPKLKAVKIPAVASARFANLDFGDDD